MPAVASSAAGLRTTPARSSLRVASAGGLGFASAAGNVISTIGPLSGLSTVWLNGVRGHDGADDLQAEPVMSVVGY